MTNIMRINIKYHAYSEPHVPVPATATEASKIDFYLRLSKPATSNISLNRHLWHFRDVPATGICGGTLIWKPLPATSKPATSRIRLYRHLWHFRDVPVTGTCGGTLSWKPLPATSKPALATKVHITVQFTPLPAIKDKVHIPVFWQVYATLFDFRRQPAPAAAPLTGDRYLRLINRRL